MHKIRGIFLLGASAAGLVAPAAVEAQITTAGSDGEMSDIVVTARKREERVIDVPLAVTAVSGDTLTRRGISSLDSLTKLVPQLVIGEGGATIQGGSIALRGISAADGNPLGDQAVSFNIDGI